MTNRATVALTRCEGYDPARVEEAVRHTVTEGATEAKMRTWIPGSVFGAIAATNSALTWRWS